MYKHVGKQVLVRYGSGWAQFADAASEGAAATIVAALNPLSEPAEVDVKPGKHQVRHEGDEYACACGKRWDVCDGEDHP